MPSPEANLAKTQELYAAFGSGDVPTILDAVADDVRWEEWADNFAQRAGLDHFAPGIGRDAVAAFFDVVATMEIQSFEVLGMMAGGDQVAVEIEIDVRLAGGGRYRDQEIHLWTFDDEGRVSRLRHYTDTAKHIAAAGGEDTTAG
jgi:ketosteroid isomerase-like protein